MGLEAATYISQLDSANPLGTDLKQQGDDHLRLIKAVLLASFPNIGGAVTLTHTQINALQTAIAAIPTLGHGEHSPTVVGTVNFTPSSAANIASEYIRVGARAFVCGQIRGAVAADGGVSFRASLPIASALTVFKQLNGVVSGPFITNGKIEVDATNDNAAFSFTFTGGGITIVNCCFSYSYEIV